MRRLLATLGIVMLTAIAARADVIAVPPQKLTLTGTLGWSTEKRPDGQEVKAWLTLTTADGKAVNLLRAEAVKKPTQYDQLVGKQVIAKVLGRERPVSVGAPVIIVTSVTEIIAAPAPKR